MTGSVALYFIAAFACVAWTSGHNVKHGTWRDRFASYYYHSSYAEEAVVDSNESSSTPGTSSMGPGSNNDSNFVAMKEIQSVDRVDLMDVMQSEHWCRNLKALGVALWNASFDTCVCVNCLDEKDYCGYHTIEDITRNLYESQYVDYKPRHGCKNGGTYGLDKVELFRENREHISESCTCNEHAQGRCCEQLVSRNGGLASDLAKECLCPARYTGRISEDLCVTYCENGGTVDVRNNACQCSESLWGVRCDNRVCGEHGETRKDGSCKCDSAYVGENCERKQIITHCFNDGLLVPMPGSPQENACHCSNSYHGRQCEYPTCQNGGWRVGTSCKCKIHHRGKLCEEEMKCGNGFRPHPTEDRCDCWDSQYWGRLCEIPVCQNEGRPKNETHCICPNPRIHGRICQYITCANGGIFTEYEYDYDPDLGYSNQRGGSCNCSKLFKGTFCTELTGLGEIMFVGLPIGVLTMAAVAFAIAKKKRNLSAGR